MAASLGSHVQDVVMRILSDADFAAEIRRAGIAAVRGGADSQAFRDYFEHFARRPGELASIGLRSESCTCHSNTLFTISSMAGPLYTCCATTTTTTTSDGFFSPEETS